LAIGRIGILLAVWKSNLMEIIALAPTSLTGEPSAGPQNGPETQPSGEFAEILQNQPDQAGTADGPPPEGQAKNRPSEAVEENPFLVLPWLSAFLPGGKHEFAAASSDLQSPGNNGAPQLLSAPIPAGGIKDPSTAFPEQKSVNGDLPSSLEKTLNLASSSQVGTLSADLPSEILVPGKGLADPLPLEKAGINNPETRFRYFSDGNENAFGGLENSGETELKNFESIFWTKEENLFPNDFNLADISKTGNHKTGDLPGSLASPADSSAGSRATGEVRLEGIPAAGPSRKPEVYEQVSQKMLWSFSQNEEKFRLILDPPHLGSIYMEIQRDKDQVKATLWAENPHAKQVLESNQNSIQKIIESEGFSLESFDVFVEQDLGAFQESRERMRNPEPAISNAGSEANRETTGGAPPPNFFVREDGGQSRAIDLII